MKRQLNVSLIGRIAILQHAAAQAVDEVKARFLLDVVVGESAANNV